MASEFIRNVLTARRKRLIGAIMQHAEREIWPQLTPEQRAAFRTKVIAEVGAYHDICLDMLRSSVDDGTVLVNEEALRLIRDMHDRMPR